MCDYSLHAVETRPAKVGDKLRSTTFANCFTRGFAALGEPNVAVCLRPGTELAFDRDVEIDHGFGRLLRVSASAGSRSASRASASSTWTGTTPITTPWSSPTDASCW